MRWLAEMPLAIVRRCSAMMPRLSAEESILMTERTAVGTGSLKPERASEIMRGWSARVPGAVPRPVRAPRPDALHAIGIGYRRVAKASA